VRTLAEHLATVLDAVAPLTPVRRPLTEAVGLVACEDVLSLVDLPGFDNSAMDGYAVQAADVADADPTRAGSAVTLRVVEDLAAGDASRVTVGAGQAARIMTGAMLPAGADAVVKVEDTDGADQVVTILRGVARGTSVRRRGEDLPKQGPVLAAGTVIGSRRVALLAAAGHPDVLVRPRPRVAVVATGAELVEPGKPLSPGQIYDSNSYLLTAAVHDAGAVTAYRECVGDDPGSLLALLTRLAEDVDVIVTAGGVSMGVRDVVKEALRPTGTVDFVQVAMQPGKPQGFGVLGSRRVPVFGLPGNPVSAYVSFEVFVRPALRRMAGWEPVCRPTLRVRLRAPLRSPVGRRQIARAVVARVDGEWVADLVAGQGSHFVADLAAANALLFIPEDVGTVAAGELVEAVLLDSGVDSGVDRGAW
jgi:molybdenum cofactor synthesis domain-containing protein